MVSGLQCVDSKEIKDMDNKILLDVRDFQASYKDSIDGATNIPVAYLKRNYHTLVDKSVYIVAEDLLAVNISARYLKRKRIQVNGYFLKRENENRRETSFVYENRRSKECCNC